MFKELLNEWIATGKPENEDGLDVSQISALFDFAVWLDTRAATLRAPERPFAGASIAPTLSSLYNCQLCGRENCSQPGICEECLTPPTESEIKSWSEA